MLRAYPEEILKQPELVPPSKPSGVQPIIYVYAYPSVSNQDEQWNYIIKVLLLIGAVVALAYVAKRLLE